MHTGSRLLPWSKPMEPAASGRPAAPSAESHACRPGGQPTKGSAVSNAPPYSPSRPADRRHLGLDRVPRIGNGASLLSEPGGWGATVGRYLLGYTTWRGRGLGARESVPSAKRGGMPTRIFRLITAPTRRRNPFFFGFREVSSALSFVGAVDKPNISFGEPESINLMPPKVGDQFEEVRNDTQTRCDGGSVYSHGFNASKETGHVPPSRIDGRRPR